MMSPTRKPESLRPMLHSVEVELEHRLEDACTTRPVRDESTAELMRLEESLLDAARAAKQAVSLRRRLRTMPEPVGSGRADAAELAADIDATETIAVETAGAAGAPDASAPDASVADGRASEGGNGRSLVREFRDANGVDWRVWPVTPEQMQARGSGAEQLGEYSDGWLAFEAIDAPQRCRLPHYPVGWHGFTNAALETLLLQADVVHARRASHSAPTRASDHDDERLTSA